MKSFVGSAMRHLSTINFRESLTNPYWRGGMGLHSTQLSFLQEIVRSLPVKQAVEFGSGGSTQFLGMQLLSQGGNLTTFDHSSEYSWQGNLSNVNLHIRPLIEFSEEDFEESFLKTQAPDNERGVLTQDPMNFSAKRTFYKLESSDIPAKIDLLLLDGPNGDGRSLGFLHALPRMSSGGIVMIDDVHHYDFEARLRSLLEVRQIAGEINPRVHPNFGWAAFKLA